MSSESVITVGVTIIGVVVAVTVEVIVVLVTVVVGTDCKTAIVTVAVWQIGLKFLSFEG